MRSGSVIAPRPTRRGSRCERSGKLALVIASEHCLLDSRKLLNETVYLPLFIQFFAPEEPAAASEVWRYVNLCSRSRGDSLYRNLALCIRLLAGHPACKKTSPERGELARRLEAWLARDPFPCRKGLETRICCADGEWFRPVLAWVEAVDRATALCAPPEVFASARRILPLFAGVGEVFVLTQGEEERIRKLFRNAGILRFINAIDGEDRGPRAACLAFRAADSRTKGRLLVMGDTISEMELARACGLPFLPLIPGCENRAWEGIAANYLDSPLGKEAGLVRSSLSQFLSCLAAEAPWKQQAGA